LQSVKGESFSSQRSKLGHAFWFALEQTVLLADRREGATKNLIHFDETLFFSIA